MTSSTSEISNTYRRHILCAEDIFSWKEVPSSEDSIKLPTQTKDNAGLKRRRVIHIDYADIFGDMVLSPDFQQVVGQRSSAIKKEHFVPPPAPPSPEYEQTVYGLSDESLKYFPRRRRGCSRVTAKIVKNLSSEFDKLVDDEPDDVTGGDKIFLKVPPTTYGHFSNNVEKNRDDMKKGFESSGRNTRRDENDNKIPQTLIRRKPIFRVASFTKTSTTNDGDASSCVIC